jgi:hypothetical protein
MQKFIEFIEIAGTFGIVSCKDRNNPNFQVWGAMSDKCKKNKNKVANMKFKDWVEVRSNYEDKDYDQKIEGFMNDIRDYAIHKRLDVIERMKASSHAGREEETRQLLSQLGYPADLKFFKSAAGEKGNYPSDGKEEVEERYEKSKNEFIKEMYDKLRFVAARNGGDESFNIFILKILKSLQVRRVRVGKKSGLLTVAPWPKIPKDGLMKYLTKAREIATKIGKPIVPRPIKDKETLRLIKSDLLNKRFDFWINNISKQEDMEFSGEDAARWKAIKNIQYMVKGDNRNFSLDPSKIIWTLQNYLRLMGKRNLERSTDIDKETRRPDGGTFIATRDSSDLVSKKEQKAMFKERVRQAMDAMKAKGKNWEKYALATCLHFGFECSKEGKVNNMSFSDKKLSAREVTEKMASLGLNYTERQVGTLISAGKNFVKEYLSRYLSEFDPNMFESIFREKEKINE